MKLSGTIGTAVLTLALGIGVPAYAQQDQHEQEEQKDKPAQEKEKKAEPEKGVKQDEKKDDKTAVRQEDKKKPEEKNTSEEKKAQEEKSVQAQHTAEAKGKKDEHAKVGRIPDDRFRANFGQEHRFRVNEADYRRDRRFQYGGYWFGFVQPWPANWLYTQDVYVIEINGVYYLCNAAYPGVNVTLSVTL